MSVLNGNNIHLSSLECTQKCQVASLLSHEFRDHPFSIILGVAGSLQNECIRHYFFLPFSSSPFLPEKKNA